jgi:hypothetical protein
MQHMNASRKLWLSAAFALALGIGGCSSGGDDDDDSGAATGNDGSVPDSAAASGAAFVAYLLALGQSDETSEPLLINDNFTPPADDETGDPVPLT